MPIISLITLPDDIPELIFLAANALTTDFNPSIPETGSGKSFTIASQNNFISLA